MNRLFGFKMMRNLYIVLTFFLVFTIPALNAYSQKQMNNWFWGHQGKGLTFNTVPPSAISSSISHFNNADICVSDGGGNFLFASNGWLFFNKDGTITDVLNNSDELRQALYLPIANNPFQFQGFTAVFFSQTNFDDCTLYYWIYDTSLKNGNGGLLSKKVLATKMSATFAATRHANGEDYWLTIIQPLTQKILSFLVSENGVSSQAVVSYNFSELGSTLAYNLKLRFNHDGTQLYIPNGRTIKLYDFDNATALLSKPIVINRDSAVGAEFSPDDTKLYVITFSNGVFQIDLSSKDSVKINASVKKIFNKPVSQDIQMGPDKKIYFLRMETGLTQYNKKGTYYPLYSINSPNSPAKYCRPDSVKIFYDDSTPHYCLPYYITPFLYEPYTLDFPDEVCPGEQVLFRLRGPENVATQTWSFGDGASWAGGSAQHSFQQDGVYQIVATITDKQNKTYTCRKEITVRNKTKTIKAIQHD